MRAPGAPDARARCAVLSGCYRQTIGVIAVSANKLRQARAGFGWAYFDPVGLGHGGIANKRETALQNVVSPPTTARIMHQSAHRTQAPHYSLGGAAAAVGVEAAVNYVNGRRQHYMASSFK